jgi:3-deoxy-manno-octulosonate cytidylyltransferase (CMP-KDO synthetase)
VARVVERARQVSGVDRIVVATDSEAIAAVLMPWDVTVVMTAAELASGTDRVAAVARLPEFTKYDVVVNLQGDEPFMPTAAVTGAIDRVMSGDAIGTAASPMAADERHDPSRVKVVMGHDGRALYFSRSPIPHLRDAADLTTARWWQHLGVYAYRRDILLGLALLPPSPLEESERLEQLRALQAGIPIGVALLDRPAAAGIDTPDDLAAAEARWLDFAEAAP